MERIQQSSILWRDWLKSSSISGTVSSLSTAKKVWWRILAFASGTIFDMEPRLCSPLPVPSIQTRKFKLQTQPQVEEVYYNEGPLPTLALKTKKRRGRIKKKLKKKLSGQACIIAISVPEATGLSL